MIKRVPTVGIIVLNPPDVLLVRHGEAASHITGTLGTPGGRIDPGETPIMAAQRELEEESGLKAEIEDLIELPNKYEADFARKDGTRLFVSHTVFTCNKFSGEIKKADETAETIPQWTPIEDLPGLGLMVNVENMVMEARKALGAS